MADLDPYQILGVAKNAKQDEIKNAYRALAKKLHPDLNPGNKEAERRFKDVSRAYEMIGTPESRARYDRGEAAAGGPWTGPRGGRRAGPFYYETQGEAPGGGGRYTFSFGEDLGEGFFESLFGARKGGPLAGEDRLYQMEISLREAILGGEKVITLPEGKRLSVKVPRGVSEGMRLRFAGLGVPGRRGGPSGDAYVELHVRPDERFRMEGYDLVHELPISVEDAVFGGEVIAPTVEGEVRLKIPKHSNSGTRLRLTGKGAIDRETGKRGDEIIILQVKLPDRGDPEYPAFEQALRGWKERRKAA